MFAVGPEIEDRLSVERWTLRPMPTAITFVPLDLIAFAENMPFSISMNRVELPGPDAFGP